MARSTAGSAKTHPMSSPTDVKADVRIRLRAVLRGISADERAEVSVRLRARLMEQPFWRQARSILAFVPARSEPDLWPAILAASDEGRAIWLPRFHAASGTYRPCRLNDLAADLRPGPHGIPEPGPGCADWDGKPLDLILVPGVGFTPSGGRLGRGQGHYDRMLAGTPGCKCGVAFEQQIIAELPLEPHDVRLDFVLTPARCLAGTGAP